MEAGSRNPTTNSTVIFLDLEIVANKEIIA